MRDFGSCLRTGKLPLKTMTGDREKNLPVIRKWRKPLGSLLFHFVPIPLAEAFGREPEWPGTSIFPERHQLPGDVPARSYPGHGYAQSQTQKVPPICLPMLKCCTSLDNPP